MNLNVIQHVRIRTDNKYINMKLYKRFALNYKYLPVLAGITIINVNSFGQIVDSSKVLLDSAQTCKLVHSEYFNDSSSVVVFNSNCFIPGFASSILRHPWNPSIEEMVEIEAEILTIFNDEVKASVSWRQYVCGYDSSGSQVVFVRLILFNEEIEFIKSYFTRRILYIYDNEAFHTLYYNFTQKRIILLE